MGEYDRGLKPPPQYQPYQSAPGVQPKQPVPSSMNRAQPGALEEAYSQQQGSFFNPGATSQHWNQVAGRYNGGTATTDKTQNQSQYNRVTGRAGDIASGSASLQPYYDVAQRDMEDDINRAAAARGSFGSSRTMDFLTEGNARLAAEQANRASDYDLRRLAEARGWEGLGLNVAGQEQGRELAYLNAGMDAAAAADAAELARLNSGMATAGAAQDAQAMRQQDAFNQMLAVLGISMPMTWEALGGLIGGDEALLDSSVAAQLEAANTVAEQDRQKTQDIMQQYDWGINAIGNTAALGSGFGT